MSPTWQDLPERELSGGRGELRFPRVTSVVRLLLWINAGAFVALFLLARFQATAPLYGAVMRYVALAPGTWREWFPLAPLWQLVTYGFLHSPSDPLHILFNALSLYFFGTMIEEAIGGRRFLGLFLASLAIGAAMQLAYGLALGLDVPTIGASGGVLCMIAAAAVLHPHRQVIFILFPLKLRTLALIMVGLDVFWLIGGGSGTAHVVHLSGAAFGFFAARRGWMWLDPVRALEKRRERKEIERVESDEQRLDKLLERIHDQGMGSLSAGDKEFLRRMSARR